MPPSIRGETTAFKSSGAASQHRDAGGQLTIQPQKKKFCMYNWEREGGRSRDKPHVPSLKALGELFPPWMFPGLQLKCSYDTLLGPCSIPTLQRVQTPPRMGV